MQKRILYITNGITSSGGLERVVSLKASYFADKYNYDVHIITLNESNKTPFYPLSNKVKVHDIGTHTNVFQYYYDYYVGVKNCINKINPDIVFVADDGLKGVLFPIIFKLKCKVIYERHTTKAIHGNGLKGKLIGKIMDFGSTKFNHFVVLTNCNKKDWQRANNLKVIPNPTPFTCEQISNINSRHTIISVGSISKVKGHDVLIKAWSEIANKFPHITLEIYGEKKDNYFNILNLIREYNLDKQVIIHDPEKNIKEKYLESVLCVLPSRVEGFGLVLIEAMECGTPCIATKCEGPIDIISNGENGFLIEINNSQDLSKKIEEILSNNYLLKQQSLNCRKFAQYYRLETIMDKWNKLIY